MSNKNRITEGPSVPSTAEHAANRVDEEERVLPAERKNVPLLPTDFTRTMSRRGYHSVSYGKSETEDTACIQWKKRLTEEFSVLRFDHAGKSIANKTQAYGSLTEAVAALVHAEGISQLQFLNQARKNNRIPAQEIQVLLLALARENYALPAPERPERDFEITIGLGEEGWAQLDGNFEGEIKCNIMLALPLPSPLPTEHPLTYSPDSHIFFYPDLSATLAALGALFGLKGSDFLAAAGENGWISPKDREKLLWGLASRNKPGSSLPGMMTYYFHTRDQVLRVSHPEKYGLEAPQKIA